MAEKLISLGATHTNKTEIKEFLSPWTHVLLSLIQEQETNFLSTFLKQKCRGDLHDVPGHFTKVFSPAFADPSYGDEFFSAHQSLRCDQRMCE